MHALHTLDGLGVIDEGHPDALAAVTAALAHRSAGVRRNAIQVLPLTAASTEAILSSRLTADEDPQVRLAAILALADLPPTPAAGKEVVRLAVDSAGVMRDRPLADAVTSAAAMQSDSFLAEVKALTARTDFAPAGAAVWPVVARVTEHIARGRPDARAIEQLLGVLDGSSTPMAESMLAGLARGWPKNYVLALPPAAEARLAAVFTALPAGSQGRARRPRRRMGQQSPRQVCRRNRQNAPRDGRRRGT